MSVRTVVPVSVHKLLGNISEVGLVLVGTMFLPFFIHMIPSWDDSPIGAKLLPIFYAPLFAALTKRLHVSLIACILAPWLNHLFVGNPSPAVASMLSVQLIPFAYIVHRIGGTGKRMIWFVGPIAYVMSKPFILLLFWAIPDFMPTADPFQYTIFTTFNAFPGIVILSIVGYFSTRFQPPVSHV